MIGHGGGLTGAGQGGGLATAEHGGWALTGGVCQAEGLALLQGGHLVEGLRVLGVLEATEVDTPAVEDHVGQLLCQLDLGLLLGKIHQTA